MTQSQLPSDYPALLADLKQQIHQARVRARMAVNHELEGVLPSVEELEAELTPEAAVPSSEEKTQIWITNYPSRKAVSLPLTIARLFDEIAWRPQRT